jgi:hypothetical protein
MSNTLKDRPAWVKLNDPRTLRVMRHRHNGYWLGRKFYRTEYVRDEQGHLIWEMKTATHKGYSERHINYKVVELLGLTYSQIWQYEDDFPELFYWHHVPTYTYEYREYKTERVLVREAPDHCTAGEPVGSKLAFNMAPCHWSPVLPRQVYNKDRNSKDKQRFLHSRERGRWRNSVKNYAKAVNSAEDYLELDAEDMLPSFTLREAWYWED